MEERENSGQKGEKGKRQSRWISRGTKKLGKRDDSNGALWCDSVRWRASGEVVFTVALVYRPAKYVPPCKNHMNNGMAYRASVCRWLLAQVKLTWASPWQQLLRLPAGRYPTNLYFAADLVWLSISLSLSPWFYFGLCLNVVSLLRPVYYPLCPSLLLCCLSTWPVSLAQSLTKRSRTVPLSLVRLLALQSLFLPLCDPLSVRSPIGTRDSPRSPPAFPKEKTRPDLPLITGVAYTGPLFQIFPSNRAHRRNFPLVEFSSGIPRNWIEDGDTEISHRRIRCTNY